MRIRPLLTTLAGIVIAAGSVFFAKERLLSPNAAAVASQEPELVNIVVARNDIPFGNPIEAQDLEIVPWPAAAFPQGAFQDANVLLPDREKGPRRARGAFFKGEVILASKVSAHGEKVTIVQKLNENTRAMAIKVNATTAVGGFVTPGDYVDILLTQGRGQDLRSVTILQNIRVIGVDQKAEENSSQPDVARTITVEVTPEQGQKLALAQKAGTLSLTLRSQDAPEDAPLEMLKLSDLLQEVSPLPEGERAPVIKVRRGTEEEEVTVD